MRTPEDLHPDDAAMRSMLRDLLVYRRTSQHLSQRALARRMGVKQSTIAHMEHSPQWRVSRLQRWTHHLERPLVVRFLGLPCEFDPAMYAFRPADPVEAWAWERAALRNVLIDSRRALGVRQSDLGEVLGCGERSVSAVESGDDSLLSTWQRYARALGGAAWVGVG